MIKVFDFAILFGAIYLAVTFSDGVESHKLMIAAAIAVTNVVGFLRGRFA